MLRLPEDTTTSVTIEHLPSDGLTVATFDWPIAQPEDTYTLDPTDHLSMELDRHFPVRPVKLSLTETGDANSLAMVELLTGAPMAEAMRVAPLIGYSVLQVTLDENNRLAIARLQIESPSTPRLLFKACKNILNGLRSAKFEPA